MEFRLSPEEEAFRQQVRDFLKQELPPDWRGAYEWDEQLEVARRLQRRMGERGWLAMHWPREFGGQDASPVLHLILCEELAYHKAPGRDVYGVDMVGPTLIIWGTQEQKRRFLPPIARGEVAWCQGYSEPRAGSDLASLETEAVRDGDDYVINGLKIWTSRSHLTEGLADWMFLLARTDPSAPKHRGISFFLLDLNTPGVKVEPLPNMAGFVEFNRVKLRNVRVPASQRVGPENRGWYVAMTLLDYERSGVQYSATARRYLEDLLGWGSSVRLGSRPLTASPLVRHRAAELFIEVEAARLIAYKVAWAQKQGQVPNKEATISKLFGSELLQRVLGFGMQLMGLYGQLEPGSRHAPLDGYMEKAWLFGFSHSIAAGTSEIMRNIIALRGLGLPRA